MFAFSLRFHRRRNQVEHFFNQIKQLRDPATRYDRRSGNSPAALNRDWINI